MTTLRLLLTTTVLAALLHLPTPYAAARAAPEDEGGHDAFSATVRLPGHGRCRISKSDAAVRASVRCRDGHRLRVRPCPHEDSERCFWHAPSRGNGEGRSFLRVRERTHYFRG